MSDAPTGLLKAIAAVQKYAPTLPKDKKNPHFKSRYTSLDKIVELVTPLLDKYGLVWTALPVGTHDQPALSYRLAHAETGDAIEGTMPLLLDKHTAQALGSALTYARRYALCAVLNLVADEDDDGTAASSRARTPEPQIIKEDEKQSFVDALKSLTGAGPDHRDQIVELWKTIRGQHERPLVDVAAAIHAIDGIRAVLAVQGTFAATEERS